MLPFIPTRPVSILSGLQLPRTAGNDPNISSPVILLFVRASVGSSVLKQTFGVITTIQSQSSTKCSVDWKLISRWMGSTQHLTIWDNSGVLLVVESGAPFHPPYSHSWQSAPGAVYHVQVDVRAADGTLIGSGSSVCRAGW